MAWWNVVMCSLVAGCGTLDFYDSDKTSDAPIDPGSDTTPVEPTSSSTPDADTGTAATVDTAHTDPPTTPPEPEVCNGLDDDQDLLIDEDFAIVVTQLSSAEVLAAHYACDLAADPMSGACRAATHRACGGLDCTITGFGPLALPGGGAEVACLDAANGVVLETSYTSLSGHHPGCTTDVRWGPECNAAISRWCADQGLTTGFGPVENTGDTAYVSCTPSATVVTVSYATDLAPRQPSCDGSIERAGPSCSAAIHTTCVDLGFAAGHGPLENAGDVAVIACVPMP